MCASLCLDVCVLECVCMDGEISLNEASNTVGVKFLTFMRCVCLRVFMCANVCLCASVSVCVCLYASVSVRGCGCVCSRRCLTYFLISHGTLAIN